MQDAASHAIERETRAMALVGVAARVFNAAVAFATQILFARLMGPEEFGVTTAAMALMLLVAGVSTLGLGIMPQRFWPEYEAGGDAARQRGLLRFAAWAPLAIGSVFAAGGCLIAALASPWLSPAVATAACLAMLAVPAQASLDVVEALALARGWKVMGYGLAFVARPLLTPLIFLAAWLGGIRPDASLAALALAGATWLVALALLALMARRMAGLALAGPALQERGRWIRAGLPAMLADAAFLLMTSTDIVLLTLLRDDAAVGAYGAAARLVALVAFVHAGLTWATGHHFSALYSAGETDRLAAYAAKTARWCFWPSLGLAAGVALAAPLLLAAFGKGFAGGAPVTAILLLGLLARAAAGPAEQLLTMTDNQEACAYAYAWAFVVNLGLGAALIPEYGGLGAAASTAFAYLAATLIVAREVRLRLGFTAHVAALRPQTRREAAHA